MASTTGSLTTTGSVTLTKEVQHTMTILVLSGTYGTVTFVVEGSLDGSKFAPLASIDANTGSIASGTISPSDNSTVLYKAINCDGLQSVRARVTAITSGQADFALASGSYVGLPALADTTNAVTVNGAVTATNLQLAVGASTAAAGNDSTGPGGLPAGTAAVYPTTAADDTKGVKISTADNVTKRTIFITNGVSNKILKVYPPTGGTINGAAANVAFSSASGKGVTVICTDSTANTAAGAFAAF